MSNQDKFRENCKWYIEIQNSHSSFQEKILRVCFLYPFQDEHFAFIGRLFIVLFYVAELLGMILKIIDDTSKNGVNSSSAESLFQLIAAFTIIYNYATLSVHFKKVPVSIRKISKIRESSDLLEQKIMGNMLQKAITYNTIISNMFVPITIGFGIAPVSIPILCSWILPGNQTFHKTLPLAYDFRINTDEYFYFFYVVQLIALSHFACIILSMNILQCLNIGVIIGQFQYMQYYLKQTDIGYYQFHDNEKMANNYLTKRLKQVIKKHHECIELYEMQQSISNSIMLVTLLGASTVLVIGGTSAVMSINTNLALAAKMMSVYCGCIATMIMMCTPSQLLYNASYTMSIESYCINWYEYTPKARLFIVLLLVRTQKTIVLKAGTIIDLNFETCSTVIKKSLSFIAAFRSLYSTL